MNLFIDIYYKNKKWYKRRYCWGLVAAKELYENNEENNQVSNYLFNIPHFLSIPVNYGYLYKQGYFSTCGGKFSIEIMFR